MSAADRCICPECISPATIEVRKYARPFGLCDRHWNRYAGLSEAEKDRLALEWRRGKRKSPPAACCVPDCGKPCLLRCHHCDRPLCAEHLSPRFLTAHCAACTDAHHGQAHG